MSEQKVTKEDLQLLSDLRARLSDIEEKLGYGFRPDVETWPKSLDTWYCKDCNCNFHDGGQTLNHGSGKDKVKCYAKGSVEYIGKKEVHLMEDARSNPVTRFEGQLLKDKRRIMTAEDIKENNAAGSARKGGKD